MDWLMMNRNDAEAMNDAALTKQWEQAKRYNKPSAMPEEAIARMEKKSLLFLMSLFECNFDDITVDPGDV